MKWYQRKQAPSYQLNQGTEQNATRSESFIKKNEKIAGGKDDTKEKHKQKNDKEYTHYLRNILLIQHRQKP